MDTNTPKVSGRIQRLEPSATLAMSAKVRELKAQGVDVISLSLGETDFFTPDAIKEAAKKAIDDNYSFYSPVAGYPELKKAVCHKFKRDNNLDYQPNQIVVSTGAKNSIYNVMQVLVDKGDEVLVPAPYWVSYVEIIKLAEGTPVVGGAGDNAAAAVGTGTVRYGKAFTTLGTSGVVFAHADSVSIDPAGRVHTFCSAVPGKWAVMSCTLAAGQSLRWLRDTCCAGEVAEAAKQGVDPYELMTALAEKTPIGADGLLFLPYLMGERSPLLDEKARGAFIGLSGGHGRGHLIRAVLEGVTYSQRQCVDVLRGMNVPTEEMMACGGGARSAFWRQMLADVYGCPIQTAKAALEGPALGVAILAGVGTGVYPSVESACDAIVKPDTVLYPDAECGRAYEPYYQLYLRQYPALRETFHALAAMRSRA